MPLPVTVGIKTVGLCPVHADEFYVPNAEKGDICPACDKEMVIYEAKGSTDA